MTQAPWISIRSRPLEATTAPSSRKKRLFLTLSVFPAPFDADAAAAVADLPDASAVEALTGLVAKSLVFRSDSKDGPVFEAPETIRQYALEVLTEEHADDLFWQQLQQVHSEFYLEKLEATSDEQSLIELDIDQIRAAAEWSASNDPPDSLVGHFDRVWPTYRSLSRYREAARVIGQSD